MEHKNLNKNINRTLKHTCSFIIEVRHFVTMANVGFGSKHVRFTSPIHYNDQETDSSESEKESVRSEELKPIRLKGIKENEKIEDKGASLIFVQIQMVPSTMEFFFCVQLIGREKVSFYNVLYL